MLIVDHTKSHSKSPIKKGWVTRMSKIIRSGIYQMDQRFGNYDGFLTWCSFVCNLISTYLLNLIFRNASIFDDQLFCQRVLHLHYLNVSYGHKKITWNQKIKPRHVSVELFPFVRPELNSTRKIMRFPKRLTSIGPTVQKLRNFFVSICVG